MFFTIRAATKRWGHATDVCEHTADPVGRLEIVIVCEQFVHRPLDTDSFDV